MQPSYLLYPTKPIKLPRFAAIFRQISLFLSLSSSYFIIEILVYIDAYQWANADEKYVRFVIFEYKEM